MSHTPRKRAQYDGDRLSAQVPDVGPAGRFCLVTVTDDDYARGTLVMLRSFLAHNPWFDGDILLVHMGLREDTTARLANLPRVRFRLVSSELRDRVAAVGRAIPSLRPKAPILYSIEAFDLGRYDRVLKIDGDILCTGGAADLMDRADGLCACPDRFYFRRMRRQRRSYVPVPEGAAGDLMPVTFNPGVMQIAPAQLPASTYPDLVSLVEPRTWEGVRTGHSDSIVLNRYFEGRWTQVSEKFNYLLTPSPAAHGRPRVPIEEAVFLHFLTRPKPWQTAERVAIDEGHARSLQLWDASAAQATGPRFR